METSNPRAEPAAHAAEIDLTINGEPRQAPAAMTLSELLVWLRLDPRKVAVERNLEIAVRSRYDSIRIEAGDRLEIVHFVGGG